MGHSTDFRRKVLEIKELDGLSLEEAALRSGISGSGVFRWLERLERCLTRSRPAAKIDMDALAHDAEETPDAFQHERAERSGCSQRGICDALKQLKITRKKRFFIRKLMRMPAACSKNRLI